MLPAGPLIEISRIRDLWREKNQRYQSLHKFPPFQAVSLCLFFSSHKFPYNSKIQSRTEFWKHSLGNELGSGVSQLYGQKLILRIFEIRALFSVYFVIIQQEEVNVSSLGLAQV